MRLIPYRYFILAFISVIWLMMPAFAAPNVILAKWHTYSSSSHVWHVTHSSSGGFSRPSSSSSPHSSSGGISRPSGHSMDSSPPPNTVGRSSGGVSRPTATVTPQGTSGISRPGSTANGGGTVLRANTSAVDRAVAKGHSAAALTAFRAEQAKYKAPPIGVPASRQAARESPVWRQYGSQWHNDRDYLAARQRAITQAPPAVHIYYTNPPVYVANARPSYGSFSGAFLGSLLAVGIVDGMMNHSYAEWAYSNHNDPYYQQWYADMQQQAQDNADLRARLDVLNAQVQQLQAQNAATSNALPNGVDPSLVVAQSTALQATAEPSGTSFGMIALYTVVILLLLGTGFVSFARRRQRFA